jgi:hypothetical protein
VKLDICSSFRFVFISEVELHIDHLEREKNHVMIVYGEDVDKQYINVYFITYVLCVLRKSTGIEIWVRGRIHVALSYKYMIIWVNPNSIHLIKRFKLHNLDMTGLNKQMIRYDSHNSFNKEVMLG